LKLQQWLTATCNAEGAKFLVHDNS
jgi:hypothetical protein